MTVLLFGGNGQVGHELRRSLRALGDVVVTTRSGELPDGARCEVAAFDRPDSLAELVERVGELPTDGTLYLMCRSGARSAQATAYLEQQGYDAVNVDGGIIAWHEAGLPVVQPE